MLSIFVCGMEQQWCNCVNEFALHSHRHEVWHKKLVNTQSRLAMGGEALPAICECRSQSQLEWPGSIWGSYWCAGTPTCLHNTCSTCSSCSISSCTAGFVLVMVLFESGLCKYMHTASSAVPRMFCMHEGPTTWFLLSQQALIWHMPRLPAPLHLFSNDCRLLIILRSATTNKTGMCKDT